MNSRSRKNISSIAAGLLLLVTAGIVCAEIIVGFDFEGGSPEVATIADNNLTVSDWTTVGIGNPSYLTSVGDNTALDGSGATFGATDDLGCFNMVPHTTGGDDDLAYAITNASGHYLSITLTPNGSSHVINLTSLTFKAKRNMTGRAGPHFWALCTTVDGFTEGDVIDQGQTSASDSVTALPGVFESVSIDLSDSRFQGIVTATEFRIYVWDLGALAASGGIRYDKVVINGEVRAQSTVILVR